MMTQIISNTNTPDDLSRNVIDVLYYIPKVSSLSKKVILYQSYIKSCDANESEQNRSFILQPNHDGKYLRCVYDHEAYNQHDPKESKEASVYLVILGKQFSSFIENRKYFEA